MLFEIPLKSEGMKLELKIEQIHRENLKNISRLAFLSDGINVIKRMIAKLAAQKPGADKELAKDCSEIDKRIRTLKRSMINEDCHLLSFLCTGKLVPDNKLNESTESIKEVSELTRRYRMLRRKIAGMLKKQ